MTPAYAIRHFQALGSRLIGDVGLPDRLPEEVILVDADDNPVGVSEKLAAHRAGYRHRAFSVMVWDNRDRLLLQRRHTGKYHSGGLWTNSCCGHPRPGERTATAAARRLAEEMSVACELTNVGALTYKAAMPNGLTEHEFVHIFHGRYSGPVTPDPQECDAFDWLELADIRKMAAADPDVFTAWFKIYMDAGWPVTPNAIPPPSTVRDRKHL